MTFNHFAEIDLSIALRTLHDLAVRDGDIGRDYWLQISELLKDSASFRYRALVAEERLRQAIQRENPPRRKVGRGGVLLKERARISRDYPRDIARMQAVLVELHRKLTHFPRKFAS
ncbi:hypothetical protein FEE59_18400 [Herbaspirillum sp. RU 5E]|nr:hypothetical protein [Herbaspirillum sp. RU 5E]